MLVAFTGPQSSGKSTLITEFKNWVELKGLDFNFKPSATRLLKAKGYTINNIGYNFDVTQIEVILSHINNIIDYKLKGGNVILDRCILDGVVYTNYFFKQGKVCSTVMDAANYAIENYYSKYDRVFYLDTVGVPLVDDKERSTDNSFRNDIIEIFNSYMQKYNTVMVSGSIEQRLEQIVKNLNCG